MIRKLCIWVCLAMLTVFVWPSAAAGQGSVSEFAGRYTDGKDMAVYFEMSPYGLTIRPVLWTATQLLVRQAGDNFVVVDRTSRGAEFYRDKKGAVAGVNIRGMDGEGIKLTRASGAPLAVELFLRGRTFDAARLYLSRGKEGADKARETAARVLERLPTKTSNVVALLLAIEPRFSTDAGFYALLGSALVQQGRRGPALSKFRKAYKLDPHNEDAISGLARLGHLPRRIADGKAPWPTPFPLDKVFAKPTVAEISAVEKDWASRDLSPAGVKEELRDKVRLGDWEANIRIVSHLVHGSRHYGAIIYPDGAGEHTCPVIVVAKGVSPTYFPLEIGDTPDNAIMGDLSNRFIFVIPSFRGEVLSFKGRTFTSEGDRRDALDGATDDALALLNVALETTPAADPGRICVYGQSRGGNVALLAGIRDKRIKCVVDLAGPTDWFYLMGTNGWTEQELWTEAVRIHADTLETGGQNLERFYMRAIEGNADLAAVRHNMIASSPLYFASRLPLTQMHYGIEDPFVPVRNGRQMVAELVRHHVPRTRYQAFFYPGEGHDTDRINGPVTFRKFIASVLNVDQ